MKAKAIQRQTLMVAFTTDWDPQIARLRRHDDAHPGRPTVDEFDRWRSSYIKVYAHTELENKKLVGVSRLTHGRTGVRGPIETWTRSGEPQIQSGARTVTITRVVVHRDYREKGIYGLMMSYALLALKNRCNAVFIPVEEHLQDYLRDSLGYRQVQTELPLFAHDAEDEVTPLVVLRHNLRRLAGATGEFERRLEQLASNGLPVDDMKGTGAGMLVSV